MLTRLLRNPRSAILAILLCLSCFGVAVAHDQKSKVNSSLSSYDLAFIDAMTQHHRDGIKMMDLAAKKAESQDVAEMAGRGAQDQKAEIDEMQRMKPAPSQVSKMAGKIPGVMPPGKMMTELARLEKSSGKEFDRMFLQMMIEHHKGAVKMADDALTRGSDGNVKMKAREIHDKQSEEISQMKKMLAEVR